MVAVQIGISKWNFIFLLEFLSQTSIIHFVFFFSETTNNQIKIAQFSLTVCHDDDAMKCSKLSTILLTDSLGKSGDEHCENYWHASIFSKWYNRTSWYLWKWHHWQMLWMLMQTECIGYTWSLKKRSTDDSMSMCHVRHQRWESVQSCCIKPFSLSLVLAPHNCISNDVLIDKNIFPIDWNWWNMKTAQLGGMKNSRYSL